MSGLSSGLPSSTRVIPSTFSSRQTRLFESILFRTSAPKLSKNADSSGSLGNSNDSDFDNEGQMGKVWQKSLLPKCYEIKRVIDTTISVGRLGQDDTHETRAVLCLLNVVKNYNEKVLGTGVKVECPSIDELANAIGLKRKRLLLFRDRFSHYLEEQNNNEASVERQNEKAPHFSEVVSAHGNELKISGNCDNKGLKNKASVDLLQRLGISMASTLPSITFHTDAPSRAQGLLSKIQNYMLEQDKFLTDAVRYDLRKFDLYYSAACFYHIILHGGTMNGQGRVHARGRHPKEPSYAEEAKEHLIRISGLLSDRFNNVYKTVARIASMLPIDDESQKQMRGVIVPVLEKSRKGQRQSKVMKRSHHLVNGKCGTTNSGKLTERHNDLLARNMGGGTIDTSHIDSSKEVTYSLGTLIKQGEGESEGGHGTQDNSVPEKHHVPSKIFQEWRDDVMRSAIDKKREDLSSSDVQDIDLSERDLLNAAASDVLKEFGLS